MSRKLFCSCICVSLLAAAGCDAGLDVGKSGQQAANPGQPKDLSAPWVNKTDEDFGISSSSSDATGNRIFSCTTSDFRGLLQDIAAEFKISIVVKPRKMLDWNLTVEVKGKDADEVLNDIATKCRLSLEKSSGGLPKLVFPGDTTGDEATIKPGGNDGENENE
jgi:hypothetical protein